MICFVTTRSHRYTHKHPVAWSDAPKIEIWSYDRLLTARRLPTATWVFCDFDRLGFWELELAARVWRILKEAGLRVLNDPALARQRYALLRRLNRSGINSFNVWHVDTDERPEADAFPVFIRTDAAHRGVIGGLIPNRAELERRIGDALSEGFPRRDLIIVQYAAEPIAGGLFRKLAVFKVGDRTVPALCVHQDHWCVQTGTRGIATPELYREEQDIIERNPYGDLLLKVFAAAEIDYGRADFSFPRGGLAVYEINTNPAIGAPAAHPSQVRVDSYALWRTKYVTALANIDTAARRQSIRIDGDLFATQRRRDFPITRPHWIP